MNKTQITAAENNIVTHWSKLLLVISYIYMYTNNNHVSIIIVFLIVLFSPYQMDFID